MKAFFDVSTAWHSPQAVLLALVACAWPSGWGMSDTSLDLFVLVGQSNMQGYMGNAESYPRGGSHHDKSIHFYYLEPSLRGDHLPSVDVEHTRPQSVSDWNVFYHGIRKWLAGVVRNIRRETQWPPTPAHSAEWSSLGPQWGRFPSGHFGPEISFARQLHHAGFAPAIFKYSKESTSLANDWKAPGEGGLYDHFLATLRSAMLELRRQGYNVNIRGFIWLQGESDALSDQAAEQYADRLRGIVQHFRKVMLAPSAPVILGADEAHPMMLLRPMVRQAQEEIAMSEPCIIRSSMRGLQKADSTHLTPDALVVHGTRLYNDYLLTMKECG